MIQYCEIFDSFLSKGDLPMATSNSSVPVTENVSIPTAPQRNERPFVGDKPPKFVIKIQTPVPA